MTTLPLRPRWARIQADESSIRHADRAGLSVEYGPVHELSLRRQRGDRASRYRVDVYGFSVPLPGPFGPCPGHAFCSVPRPAGLDVAIRLAPCRHLSLP